MLEKPVRSVLFVCTGNTCRSPMAEALLMARVRQEGLPIVVQSAGLGAAEGCSASPEAVVAVRALGADLTAFRSQPLTPDLLANSDLILTMTGTQFDLLMLQYSELADRAHTLLGFAHGATRDGGASEEETDILDPIGAPQEVYGQRAEQINLALVEVMAKLLQAAGHGEA